MTLPKLYICDRQFPKLIGYVNTTVSLYKEGD
jgi:hypothetical protein